VEWAFKVRGITPGNQDAQGQPAAPQAPRDRLAGILGVRPEDMPADEQAPAPQQQTKLPEETQDTLRGQMFERAVSFMSPALEKDGLNTQDVVRIDKIPDRRAIRVFFKDGSSKYYYPK
jgi:hypothetical protein